MSAPQGLVSLIRLLVALEMLLLPAWVGAVCVGAAERPWRRLLKAPAAPLLLTGVLLVLAALAGQEMPLGVLKAQAVAVGFVVLLGGLAAAGERTVGPRFGQAASALAGWALVGSILLAGPLVQLARGPALEWCVRVAVLSNPLVAAEQALGLLWTHQDLTYRLSTLGDSYLFLAGDPAAWWWKTLLAHLFVGSGLLVFSRRRPGRPAQG